MAGYASRLGRATVLLIAPAVAAVIGYAIFLMVGERLPGAIVIVVLSVWMIGTSIGLAWWIQRGPGGREHRTKARQARAVPDLTDVIDAIPLRVFWKDLDGRYLGCNQPFAEDAGLESPAEIIGLTDHELAWKEVAHHYRRDDAEVISTGRPKLNYEEPQTGPEGARLWLMTSKVPLRDDDGRVIGVLGTYEDITPRKEAEERIRRSEEHLRITLDSIGDAVIATHSEGKVAWMNRVAEALTGWSFSEASGRLLDEIMRIRDAATGEPVRHPPSGELDRADQAGAVHGLILVSRDGTEHRIARTVAPIAAGNQAGRGVVVVFRDVTEEYRLQEQLRESRKLEAVGRLAGGVAHDFNNALAAIMGNVAIARADIGNAEALMECLDEIDLASRRAASLVQKIVTFSRGKSRTRREVEMRPVVEDAIRLLQPSLPASVELHAEFGRDGDCRVSGDPAEMHQVVMNLVTNALQSFAGKAGRIEVKLEETDLDEEATRLHPRLKPGRFVHLRVEDDGCGMTPEILGKVYEPFFTTRKQGHGAGLGLAIVRAIVESHAGAITLESSPGSGTRARIWIPALCGKKAERPPPEPRAPRERRILYLDDDEPLIFLVKRLMKKRGYQVSGYTSAKEALGVLRDRADDFDLVVTDHSMPEMSGIEFTTELRSFLPQIPVILVSGYLTEERTEVAMKAGVREVVYKPDTVDHLVDAVEKALRELE